MSSIGFIGAGQMGEPMVGRLIRTGHEVCVYARREDVRRRLKDNGARLVDSVAELASGSDVVISCLFSDEQLNQVMHDADGIVANAKDGALVISHTTGQASVVTELARSAPRLSVVDAPVSGTTADVLDGHLTVLVGGEPRAVNQAKALVSAYADPIIETGILGTALNLKLINNVLFAANAQLLASAAAVGGQLGVAEKALLDALEVCSGGSRLASYARQFGGIDVFAAGAAEVLVKDFAAFSAAVGAADADPGLLSVAVRSGPLDLAGS